VQQFIESAITDDDPGILDVRQFRIFLEDAVFQNDHFVVFNTVQRKIVAKHDACEYDLFH